MLIVFNLDWKACDIDKKVAQASRNLNTLVEAMGARQYVHYDLTSTGAGERIFWKSTPPERREQLAGNLDFLRRHHHLIRQDLDGDPGYRKYRETAEMLGRLRGERHTLAVVFNGETAECDEVLKRARLREFFDTRVYGTDSVRHRPASLSDLYAEAVAQNTPSLNDIKVRRNNEDVRLAVDDTLDGVRAGSESKLLVAAYVSLDNCPDNQARERWAEMVGAGATYVATTPRDIVHLSDRVATDRVIFGRKIPLGLPADMPVLDFGGPKNLVL